MKYPNLLLLIIILGIACSKEEKERIVVDAEFEPYVESFITEAAARGIDIDFEETGLSITFGETPTNANGVCTSLLTGISSSHEIIIDRNLWRDDHPQDKARLIFHELGHCHLLRAHITDTLSNGEWNSLMRGVPPPGFGSRSFNFTGLRREYYIDELFDETTPPPDWANLRADYHAFSEEQKEEIFRVENQVDLYRSADLSGNFEIEMQFVFTEDFTRNAIGFAWGGLDEDEAMGMALSVLNLLVINRLEGYGIIYAIEDFEDVKINEPVKLTVQRVDSKYYYFVNERFIYWSEFEPLKSSIVQITRNSSFMPTVDYLTVKQLK